MRKKYSLDDKQLLEMKKKLEAGLSTQQLEERSQYIKNMQKCYYDLGKEADERIKEALIEIEGFIPGPKMIKRYAKRIVSQVFKGSFEFVWKDKSVLRFYKVQVDRKENGDGTMNFTVSQKIERLY